MEIETNDYHIYYNTETATIICNGSLRLKGGEEYTPIADILEQVVELSSEKITLDLRELKFLNSAGITMISKFVINVRDKENIQLAIEGSKKIAWQRKSLLILKKLMPNSQLDFF